MSTLIQYRAFCLCHIHPNLSDFKNWNRVRFSAEKARLPRRHVRKVRSVLISLFFLSYSSQSYGFCKSLNNLFNSLIYVLIVI